MKSICIKSNNNSVINYLLENFSLLNMEDIVISTRSFKIYNNIIIHYTGKNIKLFHSILCNLLTNCIIIFYEKNIVKFLINYNYFYFDDLEKKEILNLCLKEFNLDYDIYNEKYLKIYNVVSNYITEHKSIVLSGFVNFRLSLYKEFLDSNIDTCISNFLIEKEYYEFIDLLRLYVNSKNSGYGNVHLVYVNNESILIDDCKNIVPIDKNISNVKYLSDISFSSNDYCLNTLLNILPKKITIHLIDNCEDEFINTLKLIFDSRVSICNECDICRVYRLTHNITNYK